MINILVVDDDLIIRDAFHKLIEWKDYDFCLKATAHNGQEALEIIRKEKIDIVITDIKMPIMNGLELVENVKEEQPHIKCIILSGFDEFYLVNEAYKLGVSDYLLKMELKSETVLEILLKLSKEINRERFFREQEKINKELLFEMKKYSFEKTKQEKLLKEYIYGNHSPELYKRMESGGISIDPDEAVIVILRFSNYYTVEKELFNGERELFAYGIFNVFQEILEKFRKTYFFSNLPHEYVLISNSATTDETKNYSEIIRIFIKLRESIYKVFGMMTDGGFCHIGFEQKNVKSAYQHALTACDFNFVVGKGNLVDYADVPIVPKKAIGINEKAHFLIDILKSISVQETADRIQMLKIDSEDVSINDISAVKSLFNIYYYEILDYVKENGEKTLFRKELEAYKENLSKAGYLNELNSWIEGILLRLDAGDGNKTINKIKAFIHEHYSEQILLSDLAKNMQISESNLSCLFKKKIQMSFTQYLMSVRMEKAKELMKNSSLKVYEISERVGYANVEHFSRLFKQNTGKAPKEYMYGKK